MGVEASSVFGQGPTSILPSARCNVRAKDRKLLLRTGEMSLSGALWGYLGPVGAIQEAEDGAVQHFRTCRGGGGYEEHAYCCSIGQAATEHEELCPSPFAPSPEGGPLGQGFRKRSSDSPGRQSAASGLP